MFFGLINLRFFLGHFHFRMGVKSYAALAFMISFFLFDVVSDIYAVLRECFIELNFFDIVSRFQKKKSPFICAYHNLNWIIKNVERNWPHNLQYKLQSILSTKNFSHCIHITKYCLVLFLPSSNFMFSHSSRIFHEITFQSVWNYFYECYHLPMKDKEWQQIAINVYEIIHMRCWRNVEPTF